MNSSKITTNESAPFDIRSSATRSETAKSTTDPQFGEVLNKIQSQMGVKPQKPHDNRKEMGKDDFLRIMVTQMKNQDPTSPFKAEQMAAQMAQFASLEQLHNMNTNLTKMSGQGQPLERLAMTGLIGKTVTVDRDRFQHVQGENQVLSFALPKDAKQVHLSLVNESGEVVLEQELGSRKAGEGTFNWDGNKSNSIPAQSGSYVTRVSALDEQDRAIPTSSQGQARVVGISFEGTDPVFIVGDSKHQEKVLLKNISRIEDGSILLNQSSAAEAQGDTSNMQPQPRVAAVKEELAVAPSRVIERGFPNGLQDGDLK